MLFMRSRASFEGTGGTSGMEVVDDFACAWRTDRYREIRGGAVAVDDWASLVFAMFEDDPLYSSQDIERASRADISGTGEIEGSGPGRGGLARGGKTASRCIVACRRLVVQ
jgi:hypothetical protein